MLPSVGNLERRHPAEVVHNGGAGLILVVTLVVIQWIVVIPSVSRAGDWPQILGPTRNGVAIGEKLDSSWPAAGPRQLWKIRVGEGYAGPAVVGNRVLFFHRAGAVERLESLSAATGKREWVVEFPAVYRGGVNADRGPRCVPTVHAGRVYVFGAAGDLHCADLGTGKKIWSRDTWTDFDAPDGYFGAGSSPIVVDEKLVVNIGGKKNAGIVAFDLATGKTVWAATDGGPSYSSPTSLVINKKTKALFVTRLSTVLIDPSNGSVEHQFQFGKRGPTVNGATPIVVDGRVIITASYGIGAKCVSFAENKLETVWENDQSLSSQYATPVPHKGSLFGVHGREDIGRAELRCVQAASGVVNWTTPNFGVANIIRAEDMLLILNVEGRLTLARADRTAYRKLQQANVATTTTRAIPALAGGRFFFRSNPPDGGTGTLTALKVGE